MVGLGMYFLALFALIVFMLYRRKMENAKWLSYVALFTIPLGYVASQVGWIVAELGRQPWAIQDALPLQAAVSGISVESVKITVFLFAALFTALLIAEIKIMVKQIKKGADTQH
jgi:cytochrome d ubiquinol oxidase subunit I